MTVRLLVGDFGSGKTTTAKWKASTERNAQYIDCEKYLGYARHDVDSLVSRLKAEIKPEHTYYVDGVWGKMADGDYMSKQLGCLVEYVMCMASPSVLRKRQQKKAKYVTTKLPKTTEGMKQTWGLCYDVINNGQMAPFVVDTTTGKAVEISSPNIEKVWEGLLLYDALKAGKPYQDIKLMIPGEKWGYTLTGYTLSFETWHRLRDFRYLLHGRSVVDFGCHYGYFLFRCEEEIPSIGELIGIDSNPKALEVAETIAKITGSKARFQCRDLIRESSVECGGVALVLNVLHHLKYDERFLRYLYSSFDTVIVENDISAIPTLSTIAERCGSKLLVTKKSHRAGRRIVIYFKTGEP